MENNRIPLKVPIDKTEKSSITGVTIDESKFPSNSHNKEKEPSKVIAKATVKKKNSFLQTFFQEDAASIGIYILTDVIVPTIKELIQNVLEGSLNAAFWGKTTAPSRNKNSSQNQRTPYNSYYQGGSSENRPRVRAGEKKAILKFDDVIFEIAEYGSPKEAESKAKEVLDYLRWRIEEFNEASVADFLQACDLGSSFTDDKYGWKNLNDVDVVRVRSGYILDLPRAELLV